MRPLRLKHTQSSMRSQGARDFYVLLEIFDGMRDRRRAGARPNRTANGIVDRDPVAGYSFGAIAFDNICRLGYFHAKISSRHCTRVCCVVRIRRFQELLDDPIDDGCLNGENSLTSGNSTALFKEGINYRLMEKKLQILFGRVAVVPQRLVLLPPRAMLLDLMLANVIASKYVRPEFGVSSPLALASILELVLVGVATQALAETTISSLHYNSGRIAGGYSQSKLDRDLVLVREGS
jgi:hypothetical protein